MRRTIEGQIDEEISRRCGLAAGAPVSTSPHGAIKVYLGIREGQRVGTEALAQCMDLIAQGGMAELFVVAGANGASMEDVATTPVADGGQVWLLPGGGSGTAIEAVLAAIPPAYRA